MSSYTYTIALNIIKNTDAFYFSVCQNIPNIDATRYFDYTTDNETGGVIGVTIYTVIILDDTAKAFLDNYMTSYVEPVHYFVGPALPLTYPIRSETTNSITPTVVYTWIYPGKVQNLNSSKGQDNAVVNQIKVLIEYDIDDMSTAASIQSPTVTIEIFDTTRNTTVVSETIDASSFLSLWSGQVGKGTVIKSHLFTNMWDKSANYDCIWQFKVLVSDPKLFVTLNTIQYITYAAVQST